jgi:hypothetical protein
MARKDLEKLKRESQGKSEELKRLESDNVRVQHEGYEDRVEALEKQFRDADSLRKDIQMRLEHANVNWECKLRLYVKDNEDRARQTNDQVKRM